MTQNRTLEQEEIEMLLPWYAAGTLSREDADRVQAALENDQELARRYELVREEQAETTRLNEMLGAPSHRPMQRLMDALNAESADRRIGLQRRWDVVGQVGGFLLSLSPRTLAWSAAAVLAVLVIQTAALTSSYFGERRFQTVVDEGRAPGRAGSFVIIRFNPSATAADIGKFLRTHEASVVDGPKADGLYRIRLSTSRLPRDELDKLVTRMEQEKTIVGFVAPAE